jgi:hypothetical protein
MRCKELNISELIGKTLTECTGSVGDDVIRFVTTEGKTYQLWHPQDCCESVTVEDICGDLADLVGSPIVQAEENSNADDPTLPQHGDESFTWTFYRLATAKGQVVIRWYGSSNGYYSESVDFAECTC